MADWFRSWHGAPTDPKWRTIARRADARPGDVAAIVWCLLDRASQSKIRGCIEGYDLEVIADTLGYDVDLVERVIKALYDKQIIDSTHYFSAWRARQPEREQDDRRPPSAEWAVVRTRIFSRDDFTCAYCGTRGGRLECDHIVPVSRGGTNDDKNLTTSCFSCNRAKGNKLISEWDQ